MSKGANYLVYVTEFSTVFSSGSWTDRYYYHSKDAAVEAANDYARHYGCGKFKPNTMDGTFGIQAESVNFWVGVREITTMD